MSGGLGFGFCRTFNFHVPLDAEAWRERKKRVVLIFGEVDSDGIGYRRSTVYF